MDKTKIEAFLYIKTEMNNKEKKIDIPILENKIDYSLDLPFDTQMLRFALNRGFIGVARNFQLLFNGQSIGSYDIKGDMIGNFYVLSNFNPNIIIEVKQSYQDLTIRADLIIMPNDELNDFVNEALNIKQKRDSLESELNSIVNSRFWKMIQPVKKAKARFKRVARSRAESKNSSGMHSNFKGEGFELTTELNEIKIKNIDLDKITGSQMQDYDNIYYCIDTFELHKGTINISGWLFSERFKINKLFFCLKNDDAACSVEIRYKRERKDVRGIIDQDNALHSGFFSGITVEAYKNADMFLEFEYENIKRSIMIGTLFISSEKSRKEIELKICNPFGKMVDFNSRYEFDILEGVSGTKIQYKFDGVIDIIIPVYNGIQYLEKLFEGIRRTDLAYHLIIIDDCSPDNRIFPFLQQIEKSEKSVDLIRNSKNLGFVQSVNKGLALAKGHMVLLNTDVELPAYWLERLMYPIIFGQKVASSTPLTNAGTLCSFPKIGKDNELFENFSLDEVDDVFKMMKPLYINLPTGVGFCMGMNKEALKEIGFFDAKTFSKGYGEENDWCQRAEKSGYKNVSVENLFVYHKHGGSFLSEEKMLLLKRNLQFLSKKHPDYNKDVAQFFEIDPLRITRGAVLLRLCMQDSASKPILIFNHSLGGGADIYIKRIIKYKLAEDSKIILIEYNALDFYYSIKFLYKTYTITFNTAEIENIAYILQITGVDEILVNELVTYPDIIKTLEYIVSVKEKYNSKLITLIHDYFLICPSCNLLDNKEKYCYIPEIQICANCLMSKPEVQLEEVKDITVWRNAWKALLDHCDKIVAFSNSTVSLLNKAFGDIQNIEVQPHIVDYLMPVKRKFKTTKTLNIGLLGHLTVHKGLEIVKQMLESIEKDKLNIRFVLLGQSSVQIVSENFMAAGSYYWSELPNLILMHDIDLFFIPSIWPETFSFTTEEAIKMDMPVASFNIGAPAERIAKYEKGLIITEMNAKMALSQIRSYAEKNIKLPEANSGSVLFLIEKDSFSVRYRVRHLQEQMIVNGLKSKCAQIEKLDTVKIKEYSEIIIYRCHDSESISRFIKKAHENNIKIFYDIDDFIFNFKRIKNLLFLKQEEEFSDFKGNSVLLKNCMEKCDAYTTSTNTLALEIHNLFPDKSVAVNRNVASIEMLLLSNQAIKMKKIKSDGRVALGYFSGSRTHDHDFNEIKEVIKAIMDKYANVDLKVVGFLKLDADFDKYGSRIIREDFIPFRKLPELIASVDINLMALENTIFHQCKSENKWMEAALVEVPTVADFNEELSKAIQNKVTGYVCKNAEEWFAAISALVENAELRKEIAVNAKKKVHAEYLTINTGLPAIEYITGAKYNL